MLGGGKTGEHRFILDDLSKYQNGYLNSESGRQKGILIYLGFDGGEEHPIIMTFDQNIWSFADAKKFMRATNTKYIDFEEAE